MEHPPGTDAIVALGCRVTFDADRRLTGALARRLRAAAAEYLRRDMVASTLLVASGGRRWSETVEADAMAIELAFLGVPSQAIVRERCSLSTGDNARFVAALLARRGIPRVTVVTCSWHLPRAVALFRAAVAGGIEVTGVPAPVPGDAPAVRRFLRWGRERVLTWAQQPR